MRNIDGGWPPPLADLFAVSSDDAGVLDGVEARIRSAGRSDVVRPAPSWLVTTKGVPPTTAPPFREGVPFFTEGGDLFDAGEVGELTRAALLDPTSLHRFDGDFGFIHVHADGGGAAVRSCGGRVPLYARRTGSYVAVATTLTDLVAFTPDEVELDPLVCGIWAIGWSLLPENRTFFRDVRIVPRGHVLAVAVDGNTRLRRYWDPRPTKLPKPTEERRAEHVERCRALLLSALGRDLDPVGPNLLTLSGGVDSSALAALAAGVLRYPVSTLSLLPTVEPNRSEELAYIENLRRRYRFEQTWDFPIDYLGRVDAARSAPEVAFPVVHPALGLLPRVVEEHPATVVFGGEFADHVCGSPFTYPDWIRHASLLELVRHRDKWPQGNGTLPRWIRHRLLRLKKQPFIPIPESLPPYVRATAREEYRQWRADRRRALGADKRPLPYLALESEQDGFVAMNWEVTTHLGMRRAWPFFNRQMLELAFDCHPSELVGPDTKRLLRAALDGDVPPMNLHRRTRGHWDPGPEETSPPPTPDPELAEIFELPRLAEGEIELGLPMTLWLNRFLSATRALRKRPGGPR